MKKLLFLLFLAAFTSCEDRYVSQGRDLYEMYFEMTLKDPSSLVVHKESYVKNGLIIEWEVDYGAKNSYGAMVRETVKFQTIVNQITIDGSTYKEEDGELVFYF